MSDTPRTDAECMSGETRYTDMVHCTFAQQLEHELADALEQRDRLAAALRTAFSLIVRHHECGVMPDWGGFCQLCHRKDGTEPEMDEIVAALANAREMLKKALSRGDEEIEKREKAEKDLRWIDIQDKRELIVQRDRLAEALREMVFFHDSGYGGDDTVEKANRALAAVKGGSNE